MPAYDGSLRTACPPALLRLGVVGAAARAARSLSVACAGLRDRLAEACRRGHGGPRHEGMAGRSRGRFSATSGATRTITFARASVMGAPSAGGVPRNPILLEERHGAALPSRQGAVGAGGEPAGSRTLREAIARRREPPKRRGRTSELCEVRPCRRNDDRPGPSTARARPPSADRAGLRTWIVLVRPLQEPPPPRSLPDCGIPRGTGLWWRVRRPAGTGAWSVADVGAQEGRLPSTAQPSASP